MSVLKILVNAIFIISLIGALALTALFFYGAFNPESKTFSLQNYKAFEKALENVSSEITQFLPNMRFNHNDISYYIEPDCSETKKKRFENALFLISDKTGIISFYPGAKTTADMGVGCSKESIEEVKNVFVAGEGGPTQYLDLKLYPVIKKGEVLLYEESNCDYPVTELHELLHVFGFDHINKREEILYPYVECNQNIPEEVINELKRLYSIKPMAELYFSNLTASKKGFFLSFDVGIINEGLVDAKSVMLEVYAGNEKIDVFNLDNIEFGTRVQYTAANVKLPYSQTNDITFNIVTVTDEFDKANNIAKLSL